MTTESQCVPQAMHLKRLVQAKTRHSAQPMLLRFTLSLRNFTCRCRLLAMQKRILGMFAQPRQ